MVSGIPEDLADLAVPIDSLHPYHRNARTHDLEAVAESLRVNGQYRPIVVNRGTHTGRADEILAGNGTWQAAKHLGWESIAVTYVDVDDQGARRVVLIDNRANDLAGYDDLALAELLRELDQDYAGTGFAQDHLDQLLQDLADAALNSGDGEDDPGDSEADAGTLLALADVSVAEPVHQPAHGSRWRVGDHLLVVARVSAEHDQWRDDLPGRIFCPYPDPYLTLSTLATSEPLLLVQPNRYLAGHLLDKHDAVFPGTIERLS